MTDGGIVRRVVRDAFAVLSGFGILTLVGVYSAPSVGRVGRGAIYTLMIALTCSIGWYVLMAILGIILAIANAIKRQPQDSGEWRAVEIIRLIQSGVNGYFVWVLWMALKMANINLK